MRPSHQIDQPQSERGKGIAYDRARSSEWRRSQRTQLRRAVIAGLIPRGEEVDEKRLPQAKAETLNYRTAVQDVFVGRKIPSKGLERKRYSLAEGIDHLEKELVALTADEKKACLKNLAALREKKGILERRLEALRRCAYFVARQTQKSVAGVRRKSTVAPGMSKKGKKNRKAKRACFDNSERKLWQKAKTGLWRHAKSLEAKE